MSFKEECIKEYEEKEKERQEKHERDSKEGRLRAIQETKQKFKSLFDIDLSNSNFKSMLVDGVRHFVLAYEGIFLQIAYERPINNRNIFTKYFMIVECEKCGKYTAVRSHFYLNKHEIGSFLTKKRKCCICIGEEREERRKESDKKLDKEEGRLSKRFYDLFRDMRNYYEGAYGEEFY